MLGETWRVLAEDGLVFARLASTSGMEDRMKPIGCGRHALPDGSERFVAREALLMARTASLGGSLADPLESTLVQQRGMTPWVVRK